MPRDEQFLLHAHRTGHLIVSLRSSHTLPTAVHFCRACLTLACRIVEHSFCGTMQAISILREAIHHLLLPLPCLSRRRLINRRARSGRRGGAMGVWKVWVCHLKAEVLTHSQLMAAISSLTLPTYTTAPGRGFCQKGLTYWICEFSRIYRLVFRQTKTSALSRALTIRDSPGSRQSPTELALSKRQA